MSNHNDAIVITGMGAITTFGPGVDAIWSALMHDERRCSLLDDAEMAGAPATWGQRVANWQPADLLGKRGLQFLRPSSQFLMAASLLARQDAGLTTENTDPDELGVVVGCNLPGLQSIKNYDYTAITEGPQYVSPMEAPNTLANAPASHLAIRLKARALNTTIATGQCAGLDAIGYGLKTLREGRARYVVVGGVEELSPAVLWMYRNMGVLPPEDAENAGHPFDVDSSGWLPAEGAAALVLERKTDAIARGVQPLAEVFAWSSAFAPSNVLEKRAAVLQRTAQQALQLGNMSSIDIRLVVSGANGLAQQDQVEALALHRLLADTPAAHITAAKGILGETYGAGGIFQALVAVSALRCEQIPRISGLQRQASHIPALKGLLTQTQDWPRRQQGPVLLTTQDLFGSSSAIVLQA